MPCANPAQKPCTETLHSVPIYRVPLVKIISNVLVVPKDDKQQLSRDEQLLILKQCIWYFLKKKELQSAAFDPKDIPTLFIKNYEHTFHKLQL